MYYSETAPLQYFSKVYVLSVLYKLFNKNTPTLNFKTACSKINKTRVDNQCITN